MQGALLPPGYQTGGPSKLAPRILAAFSASLALLLAVGWLALRAFDAQLAVRQRYRRAAAMRERLARLPTILDELSSNAQAYAATRDADYKVHFEHGQTALAELFEDGGFPLDGEPGQVERLHSVELAARLSAELAGRLVSLGPSASPRVRTDLERASDR
ncbi:MAG: hypothetical protein KGL53_00800, partial [Elusimicrobia bacterium]|nr:hypothetical protein [Elusimicrobiota bacterium]